MTRAGAERAGRRAETLAALAYLLRGYQIIARRIRTPAGEIDLIARKGRLIAFIEVKLRAATDDAVLAVTPTTRRRIQRAGALFIGQRPHFGEFSVRYDIAAVTGAKVTLIRDAWRAAA